MNPQNQCMSNLLTNFIDAYSDAWKENAAVGNVNGTPKTPVLNSAPPPPPPLPAPAPAPAPAPTPTPLPPPVMQSPIPGPSTQSNHPAQLDYAKLPYPSFFSPYPYNGNTAIVPMAGASTASGSHIPSASPAPIPGASDSDSAAHDQPKRSPRHCCKCGSQECKGKGGRSFCMNPCQDCGQLDCRGRNSRRPDKKCNEGWS